MKKLTNVVNNYRELIKADNTFSFCADSFVRGYVIGWLILRPALKLAATKLETLNKEEP